MNIRTKLSLSLAGLLVVGIGSTGGVLTWLSAANTRTEIGARLRLLAENRAFALHDNLQLLESELERLARRPEFDLSDGDLRPERHVLEGSHSDSVLYNTAVLAVTPTGRCVSAIPSDSEYLDMDFSGRAWFRRAKTHAEGTLFHITEDPTSTLTLKIVAPIVRDQQFAGALVGVVKFGSDDLLSPALRERLQPDTEAVLVDAAGRSIYPPMPSGLDAGWMEALVGARAQHSGTLRASKLGHDMFYAFAQVHARAGYVVLFRWPWATLVEPLRRQVWVLFGTLVLTLVTSVIASLVFANYVTRPVLALVETAGTIARGEKIAPDALRGAQRSDEIGALVRAFDEMHQSIVTRDQELREAATSLEQRVDVRTRELDVAHRALVEAERFAAMGKTSAAIAHELKNALNGLGMAVELILQDPSNSERVARLRSRVFSEVTRLRDVTDSLLSFSRTPRLERTKVDLDDVARAAIEGLADLVADRGANVTLALGGNVEAFCDAHKIQGVVLNIAKNAVEAGRLVRVSTGLDASGAFVEVEDDGPGMSPEAATHLFEPFFTTKTNGTGLGLPTSLRFVKAHGGRIETDRSPSLGGARVRVSLPILTAHDPGAPAAPGGVVA